MTTIFVQRKTLPEVWEESVIRTWKEGDEFKTEYDQPGNPPSRDTTAILNVLHPFQEPRIHRAFPGGLDDLEKYRQEVIYGVHNHWIPNKAYETVTEIGKKKRHNIPLTEEEKALEKNPDFQKWSYTYHQRIFGYETPDGTITNQLEEAIEKLVEAPHTRRAVCSLLKPWGDIFHHDPPCLNLLQFRVWNENELRLNIAIRSNDAFKAAFMNMWAFTGLQKYVAERLSERLEREIIPGEYTHHAFSYHIYGSYFDEFKGFLSTLEKRTFEQRVWNSTDELPQQLFAEARKSLIEETKMPAEQIARLKKQISKK
ncbi:MAG: thymidylate synthase [Nanoarchaeota archaeon]|nr:hypothetical protein [Nanoarchaeota archaeon]